MYYFKVIFLITAMLVHALLSNIIKLVFFFSRRCRILYISKVNRVMCVFTCVLVGMRVRKNKEKVRYKKKPVLYVGNHLSYLDILVIARCLPMVFITSVDMSERQSEGWLTSNAGSLNVERRLDKLSFEELKKNIENIRKFVSMNCPLCVFPEASSAGNENELVFFSSLFASVEHTDTMIVPFAISYKSVNGEKLSNENKSLVYFFRGQRLIPHLKNFLRCKKIEVEICFFPGFSAVDKGRKEISNICKELISHEIYKLQN